MRGRGSAWAICSEPQLPLCLPGSSTMAMGGILLPFPFHTTNAHPGRGTPRPSSDGGNSHRLAIWEGGKWVGMTGVKERWGVGGRQH